MVKLRTIRNPDDPVFEWSLYLKIHKQIIARYYGAAHEQRLPKKKMFIVILSKVDSSFYLPFLCIDKCALVRLTFTFYENKNKPIPMICLLNYVYYKYSKDLVSRNICYQLSNDPAIGCLLYI
jgi:hypothetical protein